MKKLFVMVLCLILPANGAYGMANNQSPEPQAVLTAPEAQTYALKGYQHRAWGFPSEYVSAMKGATPGEPLLVERLDRPDTYYYLVPFIREGRTMLVVMIDARKGDFLEAAPMKSPTQYPPISPEAASVKLSAALGKISSGEEISGIVPTLVWMPSEQSQSPFEPLWRFRSPQREWFVDQQGRIHKEIVPPRMKGGGF